MTTEENQLEQAVLCCVDPNVNPAVKKQALDFLEQIKATKGSWKFCLQYFMSKPNGSNEAKFFALQALDDTLVNKASTLTPEDRLLLRKSVTQWMTDHASVRNGEPTFLRNKMVNIIVHLFSQEYMTSWTTFFDELISYLSLGPPLVDLFLRVCLIIDEEIIARYILRSDQDATLSTQIKDKMREKDVERIVEVWYQVLATFYESHPELANMALSCIGNYASWIEISLIMTDRFTIAYFNFLTLPKHRDAAAECVNAIILKKMKAEKKLALIQALNLNQVLPNIDIGNFSEKMATLVNDVGVTLTNCWLESRNFQILCFSLIDSVLMPFFRLLASDDDSLSLNVFEFSQSILSIFKQEKKTKGALSPEKRSALQNLLSVTVLKMKYPATYNFRSQGDDEETFNDIRIRMKTQFENIAAIEEEMMADYVTSAVEMTLKNLDKCHFTDAELALRLLYNYADGTKGQIRLSKTEKNCDLRLVRMLQVMMQSDVSRYPHHIVQLEYFENVVRYSRFFEVFTEYMDPVLLSFLDSRGLHHPETSIRGRIMYLFFKFVKSMKHKLFTKTETILGSIYDLLLLPDTNLTIVRPTRRRLSQNSINGENLEKFNDQLQLFETVGMMISMDQIPDDECLRFLTGLTGPLFSRMDEIVGKQLYKSDTEDNPVFQTILHHAITAIASIAKGFPGPSEKPRSWEKVFERALDTALVALRALPNSTAVKDATRFLFQRLVSCLGSSILPFLPTTISHMMANCQPNDVVDFLPIITQLLFRFQDSIFPVLNQMMSALLDMIFTFLKQVPGKIKMELGGVIVNSYEAQQLLDLERVYANLIYSILASGQAAVFTSEANMRHFDSVLSSILRLAMEDDLQIQKHCIGSLTKMVEFWAEPRAGANNSKQGLAGFNQFIYQQILPLCFQIPFKSTFNVTDGQSYVILGEICGLKRLILASVGPDFLQFLQTKFLPTLGLTPQAASEYLQALQASDPKQFTKFYKNLVQSRKA